MALIRALSSVGGGSQLDYTTMTAGGGTWVSVTCGFQPKVIFFSYTTNGVVYAHKYDLVNNTCMRKYSGYNEEISKNDWIGTVIDAIPNGMKLKFTTSSEVAVVFVG